MATHPIGRHAEMALRRQHDDPFVQAALWRLFHEHPASLHPHVRDAIAAAVARDTDTEE